MHTDNWYLTFGHDQLLYPGLWVPIDLVMPREHFAIIDAPDCTICIQSIIRPSGRLFRVPLRSSGRRVSSVLPLLRATPMHDSPGYESISRPVVGYSFHRINIH